MGCGASAKRDAEEEAKLTRQVSTASKLSRSGSIKATKSGISNATSFFRRISMGSLTSLLSWERKHTQGSGDSDDDDGDAEDSDRAFTFEERLQKIVLTGLLHDGDVAGRYFFSDTMLSKRTKVVIRLVSHKKTDELAACKQHALRKADRSSKHDRTSDMIKQQAIMLKECCHPNIIQLQECYMHNGYFYEIIEYAKGGRLFDAILEAEAHTEQETANVMIQLLSATAHMHQRRICHRDIKPEHILFKDRSLVQKTLIKLVDFATACPFTEEPMTEKVTTPYYASPQVHEGLYTEGVDTWSCGVVMYLLLTGYPRKVKAQQEFSNMRGDDFLKALTKGKIHSMQERGSHISREANSLLDNLILTSEEHRISPLRASRNAWLQNHAPQHVPEQEDEHLARNVGSELPGVSRDRAGMVF
ncbi:CPK1 [Symbiodinium pilosum]|uniref:CPK1 protein n=1 Tax=Symbiodinium pilosum TaxID=2952 RepID=A0A812N7X3_SYMPI|nr:CPK1 [Symbiodinium pilosum]